MNRNTTQMKTCCTGFGFTFVQRYFMHDHDGHSHSHHHPINLTHVSRSLVIGIVLNLVFVAIEFAAGIFSDSLALLSDAGHNLSDVAGLALALLAFKLLQIKPTEKYTYGYRKASILISLFNALILLAAVIGIGYEAIHRFMDPHPVQSNIIIWVAAAGIVINALSAMLFFRNKDRDLNIKGAYLHLVADALVSVGVVASGIVIRFTQWYWMDPVISLVIMIVIVVSTWKLLQNSFTLSLDAVPDAVDVGKIRTAALSLPGIKDIHHIHVWAMSTSDNAMTAHLVIDDRMSHTEASKLKNKFRHELEHLGIRHATIETEVENCEDNCEVV